MPQHPSDRISNTEARTPARDLVESGSIANLPNISCSLTNRGKAIVLISCLDFFFASSNIDVNDVDLPERRLMMSQPPPVSASARQYSALSLTSDKSLAMLRLPSSTERALRLKWDENCLSSQNYTKSVKTASKLKIRKKRTKAVRSHGKSMNRSLIGHLILFHIDRKCLFSWRNTAHFVNYVPRNTSKRESPLKTSFAP